MSKLSLTWADLADVAEILATGFFFAGFVMMIICGFSILGGDPLPVTSHNHYVQASTR